MGADKRRLAPVLMLESAVIASGAGNGVAAIAIPWLVLERTGQPIAAGIVGAATALPLLLSSLFSGSVVDTLGKRRTSVISDSLSMLSVVSIPLADMFFGLNLPVIVALVALGAIFDPAGATAREAMIPEMAASSGWPLERMNGVHEAAWGVAYLIGPGLGGLLIALTGAAGALWATGVGFLLSGLLVGLVRLDGIDSPAHEDRPENLWKGTLEGIGLVWNDRALRVMLFVMMALVAIYMPVEGVFLPVIFEAEQAPQRLGIVLMAMSGGGVAGSLLYGAYGNRFSRRRAFVYAVVTACIAVAGMALLPPYPLLVLAATAGGFFFGPVGPLLNIAMQTRTAPSRRGRVLGVMLSAQYAAGPVGYLVAGPAVEWLGVQNAFLLFGAALLLTGLITPLLPALLELDQPGGYESELGLSDMRPPASERIG